MRDFWRLEKLYPLLVVVCVAVFLSSRFWVKKPVIDWDITLYYSYLPALFIYEDLKFEKEPSPEWGKRHFGLKQDAEGNRYSKMTGGLAVLYSPFFFAAHAFASASESYPADGFSVPYRFGLLFSLLSFTLLGLYFLKEYLKNYVSPALASLSAVLIFAGSNLPYYSFVEPMSHAYNFALISFILWFFEGYRKNPRLSKAVLLGLLAGLLIWIRPTNALFLLYPVGLLIWTKPLSSKEWWQHGIAVVLSLLIAISPQLFYWHYMTGHWVVYSYDEEGFFFANPQIWDGLFSYRKGWFVYSPLLLLALPGFALGFRRFKKEISLSLALLSLVLWVHFSWWCWWYGGGFGARSLIDYLPFMAVGLALSLEYLQRQNKLLKVVGFSLVLFLAAWSVFMNKQYKSGIFHWDSMSKTLFWKQFWKDHHVANWNDYLDPPDYDAALKGEDE